MGDWAHTTNAAGAATTSTTSIANSNLRLGATVDVEAVIAPTPAANVDDLTNTGSADDEDGVTVPASITQNASATVSASVFNNSGATAYLNAWIDFNNDGVFSDTLLSSGGERLEAARAIATGAAATTQNITFTVPLVSSPGAGRGVRVRLTNQAITAPTGAVGTGEIEDYIVSITCPTITLTAPPLAAATVGAAYSQSITASGGRTPYTYAVTTGTLPTGLSLNTSTGAITGTPTNTTSQTFTLTATDANACTGARAYTLAPVCPTITVMPLVLLNGTVGTAFSQTLTASGGTSPYGFTLTSGTLPAGLTLSSAGVLSGTPTAANGAGTSLTFRATDAYGCIGTRTLTLKICPVINLAALSTSATVGSAYSSSAAASGGASPYVYGISSGTLPVGMSLNTTTGAVTGTPTSTATRTFTLTATDANSCVGSATFTITPVCPSITVNPTSLANGTVGIAYHHRHRCEWLRGQSSIHAQNLPGALSRCHHHQRHSGRGLLANHHRHRRSHALYFCRHHRHIARWVEPQHEHGSHHRHAHRHQQRRHHRDRHRCEWLPWHTRLHLCHHLPGHHGESRHAACRPCGHALYLHHLHRHGWHCAA
jgi:hypothetical protein